MTTEVSESEATGKVDTLFAGIRSTLGVASVGRLFRRLAVYPWYLDLAWRNLEHNASTAYFHRMAKELEDLAAGGRLPAEDFSRSMRANAVMLMAAAALRAGANGQVPKMSLLSPADKQRVQPDIPARDSAIGETDSDPIGAALDPAMGIRVAQLRQRAAMAAESLPYRMEISSTAGRQAGLTEDQLDSVRGIIETAFQNTAATLAIAGRASLSESRTQNHLEPAPIA
ncbi:MAG TPA: hypothetical protein VG815_07170 [Chloroflexota bacterium]|nr:hypothetical protein [Chloroflexota bacterium]